MRVATCAAPIACSVALAALVAAPAAAADRDRGGELVVSAEGVSFDAARLSDDGGWFGYAVTRLDGSRPRYLGDTYSRRDTSDGHLSFEAPGRAYEEGYCIAWVHLTGVDDQFAAWAGDRPACTGTGAEPEPVATVEPEPPEVAPSPEGTDSADPDDTVDDPTGAGSAGRTPADAAADGSASSAADPAPAATPGTAEPTEPAESAESATSSPAETATATATDEPTTPEPATASTTASDDPVATGAERLLRSDERAAPPPPPAGTFPTLAVVGLSGLAAAAAGAMLLLRRAR